MVRSILWSLGWLGAASLLYVSLLVLELYWNVLNWRPHWDRIGMGLLFCAGAALGAIGFLAWASTDRLRRAVSLLSSLVLLGLGLYAMPAEPLSAGFVGREAPSPIWYRGGRALLMSMPAMLWAWRWRVQMSCRKGPSL